MLKPLRLDSDAPWKQRLRATAAIFQTNVAWQAPTRGLVCALLSETPQLYAWDVPIGKLRQLTQAPNGLVQGWLSPDGRHVYYLQDEQGTEHGHLWRVPFEGGAAENMTPDLPPFTLRGLEISRDGDLRGARRIAYRLVFNPVNKEGYQLWCLEIDLNGDVSSLRQLYKSEAETWGAVTSYRGALAAMVSSARTGNRLYSTIVINTQTGKQVAELWDGPENSVEAIAFAPLTRNQRLLVATTTRSGFKRPLIWNANTNERIDIDDPGFKGDILPLDWLPEAQGLLLSQFDQAEQTLLIYNLPTRTIQRLNHPSGSFGLGGLAKYEGEKGAYFTPDGKLLAHLETAAHPPYLVELSTTTGELKRTVLTPPTTAPSGTEWESVHFTSSDGQQVQGWLALPGPRSAGPYPVIIDLHGGPHFAITNSYQPLNQLWPDHGFAYLTINYRGSTLFGLEFQRKIWGDIGHWEVEDVVAGRKWLVEQGIARADQIVLMGGSYGGFLTLLCLGQHPDLWTCGISLAGVADWVADFEDASEAARGASKMWFGGTPAEKPELFKRASPITYVADVRAPVLIVHGRHDTRTPARQMENYIAQLAAQGKAHDVYWYDAGHGGITLTEAVNFTEKMLSFIYKTLGAA